MKKNILSILTIMLVLVALVSCDGLNLGESGATKGLASVSFGESATKALSVSTNAAETLVNDFYWWYKAEKTDGGPAQGATAVWTRLNNSKGLDGVVSGFSVGKWEFSFYKQDDDQGGSTLPNESPEAIITGVEATLDAGKVNYISVVVGVNQTTEGKGTLIFKGITIPVAGGNWTYSLNEGSTETLDTSDTTISEKTVENLASKAYNVVISGTYDGCSGSTVRKGEITVQIYDGLTTTISGSIDDLTTAVEFVGKAHQLSYSANIADGSSYTGTLPSAGPVGGEITVGAAISRTGFPFLGWNTKDDGTGDTYQPGETILVKADTTLYAMWTKPTKGTAKVLSTAGRTNNECGWVQLWEDGPKFATFNVGATIDTYKGVTTTTTNTLGGTYEWVDDIAENIWGENWKMPTKEDLQGLIDNCNMIPCGGTNGPCESGCTLTGYKVVGKGEYASNSIFFPTSTSVDYWSSTTSGENISYIEFNETVNVQTDAYAQPYWYVRAILNESTPE